MKVDKMKIIKLKLEKAIESLKGEKFDLKRHTRFMIDETKSCPESIYLPFKDTVNDVPYSMEDLSIMAKIAYKENFKLVIGYNQELGTFIKFENKNATQ